MADITVDVNLPSTISVDVTSPTQALATNISIPGPQGPRGEKGNPTSINNLTAENIVITGSDGNIVYTTGLDTIFISGNSGYFQSAVNSLTTNLNNTGANLNTSINNLSGLFTGYTGTLDTTYATDSQLNSTGSNLENKITSLSGTLTGNYLTTNVASNTYATISNLNSTGSTLNSSISSLSGTLTSNYATIINLASTGSNLQNQINNLDNVYATDASVTTVANNLASTGNALETKIGSLSGTLTSNYATITNLGLTGSTLNNNINSLSGTLTSNYATITNLASTGSTLVSSINSLNSAFTGFTGNLDATYATDTQLTSTGSTLVNSINSLSGTLTSNYATISNLASTGSTLVNNINSLSGTLTSTYATITNLASTGSTLNNSISSLSGTLTSTYATINNLASTGSTLQSNISSTGSSLDNKIGSLSGTLTSTYATISNLSSTGSTLNTRINDLSGYVNTQDTSISNNLISTGNTLQNSINSLSGNSVLLYGNQSIGGVKTFRDNVYINNLFVTGTETIVSTNNFNVQSPYVLLNLTGGAVDGGIFFVTGSGLTGVNDTGPIIGFDHSTKFKFGISTRNSDLSTLPDIASVQDIQAYSGVADNKFSTITNLASTGNTLEQKISSLSGTLTSTYATITNLASTGSTLVSNLASTGSTLQSNINTVSSNLISTGNNLEGKISSLSGTLTSNYATITNLASTGSTLNSSINSLSGTLTSTYATISNLASTGSTLATNLASTGSTLVNSVNSLSGTLTSTYATITNLANTGSTLVNSINSLSGTLTGNYATITNLASTGSTLNTRINNLSGYINSSNSNIVFTTGDQNIGGNKTLTDKLNITASANSDSTLKVGTLEFQPYSVNNAWLGDNTYYSGGFYRREAGYAGAFYFQGAEGQFRFADTDDAATTYTPAVQLKTHLDGRFGVGSNISTATADFTNSNFFVDSNGDVGINTVDPTEKLQVNGNIKFGEPGTASATLYMYDGPNDEYNTATWTDSELQLTQISNSSTLVISFTPEYNTLISNGSYLKLPSGKNDYIAMDAEVVHRTGIETISGVKTFASRPTVNGTGVLLSGEAAQVDLSTTIRTTGNQTVSGIKDFQSVPLVSGKEVYYQKNIVYSTGNNFTPDSNAARTFEYVLTGLAGASATLNAPINMGNGENIVIKIKQSPSGSNNMIFNAAYKFPGSVSPSLTLTPGRVDIYTILKIDSNFYSTYVKDFVN